ncbi:AraC-type DNA-binding protein [Sinomicrobium oceani]|uniref:AraC-type DNA-binding protein n=1 Tax=Sinomicrobium oceani TaxID=1150368 RepID=A0A1K1QHX5_9FLAO|nr:helix-turn-helix domain-containing protein [Sinomicrobium oceani]SFW59527.1 AraC-type DNA-binding protein [Sinomicrobium oceani]
MSDSETFKAHRIPVPSEFREVFTHFYFAANHSGEVIRKSFLPSYQIILIFSFGEKISIQSGEQQTVVEGCLLLGPVKKAFDYTLVPGSEILVANFKGDAFYRFFGNALMEKSIKVHPDHLMTDHCFSWLWSELKKITVHKKRVDFILDFSRPYLRDRHPLINRLTRFEHKNLDVVKTLAEETGQTERNIQLLHKKQLGYSAKEIHRYYRFLRAIEMLEQYTSGEQEINWFDLIHTCGYYDQSQLIHDFKYYLGLTPVSYLKFQREICNPLG